MSLSVNTNASAIMAMATSTGANKDVSASMERLSSGSRLNSASDDAAGIAIVSRLTADIRGTNQAIRNALDGQALIDVAEGSHKEIENILQRMREVSVQSANDTNNQQDRDNLHAEFSALSKEVDRIASTSTWAGQQMLKKTGSSFSFQVGAKVSDGNQISISLDGMSAAELGVATSAASTPSGETSAGSTLSSNVNSGSPSSSSATSTGTIAGTTPNSGTQTTLSCQCSLCTAGLNHQPTKLTSVDLGTTIEVDSSTDVGSKLQDGIILKNTTAGVGASFTMIEVKDNMLADLKTHIEEMITLKQSLIQANTLSEQTDASTAIGQKEIEISAFIGGFYTAREFDLRSSFIAGIENTAVELVGTINSDGSSGTNLLALEVDFITLFQNLGGTGGAEASSHSSEDGDEEPFYAATNTQNEVTGIQTTASSNSNINPLMMKNKWDLSADGTLTYSYYEGDVEYSYDGGNETRKAVSDYGANIASQLSAVFTLWDNVIDFEFEEVTEAGTEVGELRVAYTDKEANSSAYAYGPGSFPVHGDIYYREEFINRNDNDDHFDSSGIGDDGFNWYTAIHEVGHALGLSHPHDGGSANVDGSLIDPSLEHQRNTVMTYVQKDRNLLYKWSDSGGYENELLYASTPGMLDVAAMSQLYGLENDGSTAEDTTLTFAPTASNGMYERIQTVVDAGGDDVFDASAFTRDSVINLTPGTFSSLGVFSVEDQITDLATRHDGYNWDGVPAEQYHRNYIDELDALASANFSHRADYSSESPITQPRTALFTGEDNVGIADGTLIERAIGGSGNDTITGNTQDNYLTGNGGNDTIKGGSGFDIAIYNGAKSEFTITDSGSGNYSVSHTTPASNNDGTDSLSGIEIARFNSGNGTYEYYEFSSQVAVVSASETFSSNELVLSLASSDGARSAMTAVDAAIEKVNIQRSKIGAVSNRLDHTVNNLTNIAVNLSVARSGIADADFALETTNLAKNQILQQASIAMLAQANASKQNVLGLLRG